MRQKNIISISSTSNINQTGFSAILLIILVVVLVLGVGAGLRLNQDSTNFSPRAASQAPSADACNDRDKIENKIETSMLKNPNFADGLNSWQTFGSADISVISNYGIAVPTLRLVVSGPFESGVYQTVANLTPGKWYHAFYTTAQDEQPKTAVPAIRQIGVDLNGGSDPSKAVWGFRQSGGQPDRDASKVGGWKTMGAKNNPVVTFQATGPTATIFLKASSTSSGNYKVWMDGAYLGADCGSGLTNPEPNAPSAAGPSTPTANSCDASKVTMTITPNSQAVGQTVVLNMTSIAGEGTTKIEDQFSGLDCLPSGDNRGLGANFDSPTHWPKVAKYWSCTVKQSDYSWTHSWKNCADNDQSCTQTSSQCSKSVNSTNQSTSPNPPTAPTAPNTTNPKEALKSEYGIEMIGFNDAKLQLAYQALSQTKQTNFATLLKNSQNPIIRSANENLTYPVCSVPIDLNPNQSDNSFKYALIHELSHRIYFCATSGVSRYAEHTNAFSAEGPVSIYAA